MYQFITGDEALIVNHVSNHPYDLNTKVIILGKEVNSQWKVTDGSIECLVTSLDLFPVYY